jgi:uncharacterized membrane protein YhaH (DUF805 family)
MFPVMKHPDRLRGRHSLLFSGYWGFFYSRRKFLCVKLIHNIVSKTFIVVCTVNLYIICLFMVYSTSFCHSDTRVHGIHVCNIFVINIYIYIYIYICVCVCVCKLHNISTGGTNQMYVFYPIIHLCEYDS